MTPLPPYDVHDPPLHAQYPGDFAGKTVLDVGCDYGTTVEYFLSSGAARVIAVDMNEDHCKALLKNFAGDLRVTPIWKEIKTPGDWEGLIKAFKPDIVKSDCEKCEMYLLDLSGDVLRTVPFWLIECHHDFVNTVPERFRSVGFTVDVVLRGTSETMGLNCVIYRMTLKTE